MSILEQIYNFVQNNSEKVKEIPSEQKVSTMISILKESEFGEIINTMPKLNYFDMEDRISKILGVPVNNEVDLFALAMQIEVLLLKIDHITGSNVSKIENSFRLIELYGSYKNSYTLIKWYLEDTYDVKL